MKLTGETTIIPKTVDLVVLGVLDCWGQISWFHGTYCSEIRSRRGLVHSVQLRAKIASHFRWTETAKCQSPLHSTRQILVQSEVSRCSSIHRVDNLCDKDHASFWCLKPRYLLDFVVSVRDYCWQFSEKIINCLFNDDLFLPVSECRRF